MTLIIKDCTIIFRVKVFSVGRIFLYLRTSKNEEDGFEKQGKKAKKDSVFKKLKPYMGSKHVYIPLAVFSSALSAVLSMVPFYYIWKICMGFFDYSAHQSISASNLIYDAIMLFVFATFAIFLYFISLILSHFAAFEVEIGLKKKGFEKVMRMPLGFFNATTSGKIRKIINDGAVQTHTLLAHQLPDIAGSIISPLMILAIFFIMDWRLGLASLVPIALSFVFMTLMMNEEGRALQKKYFDALEEMSGESVEYVRAIPVVKTFGQSVKSFTRFYNSIENYKKLVILFTKKWANGYSAYLAMVESTALFLIPTCIFLINNDASVVKIISNFVLYILLAPQFSLILMKLMFFTQQMNVADQAIDRFHNLFVYDEMVFPEDSARFDKQEIEFKNVSFSYDGEKKVIENINLKVNKGETLALVGASGSGKTTIARLTARFWDVSEGEILIGSKNIKNYSKEVLMDNISFVFQNTELFKTTLRENICFGKKDISASQIEDALIKSRAKEIIDYLEDGLDTVIGTKGTYLSGGEKQRIALARAFIKDAPIVLLDEATAFSDPENEHLIQAALKDLSKGKTTIMIAHRMTTVMDADKIAVLDNGHILEYGNHEELMAKNGLYRKMWDEYQSSIHWNIKKGA